MAFNISDTDITDVESKLDKKAKIKSALELFKKEFIENGNIKTGRILVEELKVLSPSKHFETNFLSEMLKNFQFDAFKYYYEHYHPQHKRCQYFSIIMDACFSDRFELVPYILDNFFVKFNKVPPIQDIFTRMIFIGIYIDYLYIFNRFGLHSRENKNGIHIKMITTMETSHFLWFNPFVDCRIINKDEFVIEKLNIFKHLYSVFGNEIKPFFQNFVDSKILNYPPSLQTREIIQLNEFVNNVLLMEN